MIFEVIISEVKRRNLQYQSDDADYYIPLSGINVKEISDLLVNKFEKDYTFEKRKI
jgi:hypothetical protein